MGCDMRKRGTAIVPTGEVDGEAVWIILNTI